MLVQMWEVFFLNITNFLKKRLFLNLIEDLYKSLSIRFEKFNDIHCYSDGVGNVNEEKTFYVTADRDSSLSSIKKTIYRNE